MGNETAQPGGELTLIDDSGELAAGQLSLEIAGWVAYLRGEGFGPGRAVAIMCRSSRYFIRAFRAAWLLGCDIHYFSTEYTSHTIKELMRSANIDLLICDEEFVARVPGGLPVLVSDGRPDDDSGDAPSQPVPSLPERPAGRHVLYTSGTTGQPKPVARSRFATPELVRSLLAALPLGDDGTTTLCAAPLHHAWGMLHMRLAFARRGRLILPLYFDPHELLDLVRAHRPQVIVTIPAVLAGMVAALARPGTEPLGEDARGELEVVAVAGSALPRKLAAEATRRFGPRIYSLYGSTEAGWVSVAMPADLGRHPGTAGRPISGVVVEIRGPDGSRRQSGETGRITVMSQMSVATASGAGTRLDTGDIGFIDASGQLFVQGGADEMVVIGGENVYPAEIEEPVSGHPQVADVAVIPHENDLYGHRLTAVIVRAPGSSLTEKEILAWLRGRIPLSRLPERIQFVGEIPRNAMGKIRIPAVRELVAREHSDEPRI